MKQSSAARTTRAMSPSAADAVFQLENGARMDQKTFHALYVKTPEGFKAELIGGIVYVMSSPVSLHHGQPHARIVHWLCTYADHTPGTVVGDNTTNILDEECEPQPDAFLLIDPASGGRTQIDNKGYVHGAPELVVEVAHSTASIDLNTKRGDYEKAGVREYIVILVKELRLRWFVRREYLFEELTGGTDGVMKSEICPGLWLSARAFFAASPQRLSRVLHQGLASPEHAAFVAELETRRKAARVKKRKPDRKKPPRKAN